MSMPILPFVASVVYLLWAFTAIRNNERANPPRIDGRCPTSFCGELNITYPFRIRGDPNCPPEKYPGIELICAEKDTTFLHVTSYKESPFNGSFFIKGIDYYNQQIRIIDPNFAKNSTLCPLPKYSVGRLDFDTDYYQNLISWVRCRFNITGDPRNYIPIPCFNTSDDPRNRFYVVLTTTSDEINANCELIASTFATVDGTLRNLTFEGIERYVVQGFDVEWHSLCKYCEASLGRCPSLCDPMTYAYENVNFTVIVVFIWVAIVIGGITGTAHHLMETTIFADPEGSSNSDEDDVDSNDKELSYKSISIPRLQHRAKFSIARWDKKLGMAEVIQRRGVLWGTTGIVRDSKTFCLLEEIMYLAEIGALLLLDDDDKQFQLKDIYGLAADKMHGCSWKVFEVYKHLKALGYVVSRHGLLWTTKGNKGSCASSVSSSFAECESRSNEEEPQGNNIPPTDLFASMDITSNDVLKVNFDVYLPNKHFKKSAPGVPSFMLYIAGEIPPTVTQLEKLHRQCGDIPLKFAHVDQGRVSIFCYEKVELVTLP